MMNAFDGTRASALLLVLEQEIYLARAEQAARWRMAWWTSNEWSASFSTSMLLC